MKPFDLEVTLRSGAAGRAFLAVFLVLTALADIAAAPVPRPAPELALAGLAGGDATLASFKGRVVVIEFLLTSCPHCWRMAQTLTRLQNDFGSRGVQVLGVGIDPGLSAPVMADFAGRARVTFPVGFAAAEDVDRFLGRKEGERFQVPQFVVLDRGGTIRAQSLASGDPHLDDESYLRDLVGGLLAEPVPAAK
jgi:peroxiredoxin